MNIDTLKLDLLSWLSSVNDESILAKIRKIQSSEKVSKKQYNQEIQSAENAIAEGKGIDHKEAISKIKAWQEK